MQIGVAATPEVAIPTLDWLLASEHTIDLIITQPDKPAGRGRVMTESVVSSWANNHGIAVVKPASSEELIGKIEDLDLVLTIGYGVLLPEKILVLPKYGFLNLHFSLLPAYRGAAPAQRALHKGELTTGVSVFQLDKGMDTGPIYSQESIDILPEWRSFELLQQLAQLGPATVSQAFDMIQEGKAPTPQSGAASVASKIDKAEAKINFDQTAVNIVNAIRAFTYEPGAWTTWKGESFKVTSARISQEIKLSVGEIKAFENSVFVGTRDSAIELLSVVPAGKKEMMAIDWARGARLIGGELFG